MHDLEKRALDDPFLADAMDGFEKFDHNNNTFIELNERLKDRIKNKQLKRSTPFLNFKTWSIAASIILLIGLISIYLNAPRETDFAEDNASIETKSSPTQNIPVDSLPEEQLIADEKLST